MSITNLSKTDYLGYLACPEEFWMSYHQPELMPSFPLDAQHGVEQGNLITINSFFIKTSITIFME